jgi:phosphoenolpyruvate-protein kinase (PTS system EI component)
MMTPEQQAERLETATATAREVLSELNSAGKDLRATLKDARALLSETSWEGEVRAQMTALAKVIEGRINDASENVLAEFKRLGDVLLGVDQGQPLEDLVQQVAAEPGQCRVEAVPGKVAFDVDPLGVR